MERRIGPWHQWFAWHPVHLGGLKFAWLRTIERRSFSVFEAFMPRGHDPILHSWWTYREASDQ